MRNLSIKGIVVGGLIQSALGMLVGGGFGLLIVHLYFEWCKIGGSDFAAENIMEWPNKISVIMKTSFSIFSFIMYVFGGFIAATIAKRSEILNSIITIWPYILFYITIPLFRSFIPSDSQEEIFSAESIPVLFTALVACACGGYLGMRRNLRRQRPSAEE